MTSYILQPEKMIWPQKIPGYVNSGSGKFNLINFNARMCEPFELNDKNTPHIPGNPNMILSQNLRLSTVGKIGHINNNIAIIADTEYSKKLVSANILQMNSSFIINDVEGRFLDAAKEKLTEVGYEVIALDLRKRKGRGTVTYNPLKHIRNYEDAEMVAECIIDNFLQSIEAMKNVNETAGLYQYTADDNRFIKQQKQLLSECIMKIVERQDKKNSFKDVSKLLKKLSKDDTADLNLYTIRKTKLIEYVSQFDDINVEGRSEEINLSDIGNQLTAIFILTDVDKTDADIYVSLIMLQISRTLVEHRRSLEFPRLPYHVQIYMCEMNRIGKIPGFLDVIAYARAYNVAYTIIDDSIIPLKQLYINDFEVALGNCDTSVVCHPHDKYTAKYYARKSESSSMYNKRNKWLNFIRNEEAITSDELLEHLDNECLVFLRGWDVIMDNKIDKK